jgi:CRISPR/Cas system-associated endonuclease Cas1
MTEKKLVEFGIENPIHRRNFKLGETVFDIVDEVKIEIIDDIILQRINHEKERYYSIDRKNSI